MGVKIIIEQKNPKGLKNYARTFQAKLKQLLSASGDLVRNEAIQSITSGSKSGVTYQKYNPKRTHTSSARGEAPASDTGFLVSNIVKNVKNNGLLVEVESKASYSQFLEFGTQNMKPRPFMFPALEKNKPKIRRLQKRLKGKA